MFRRVRVHPRRSVQKGDCWRARRVVRGGCALTYPSAGRNAPARRKGPPAATETSARGDRDIRVGQIGAGRAASRSSDSWLPSGPSSRSRARGTGTVTDRICTTTRSSALTGPRPAGGLPRPPDARTGPRERSGTQGTDPEATAQIVHHPLRGRSSTTRSASRTTWSDDPLGMDTETTARHNTRVRRDEDRHTAGERRRGTEGRRHPGHARAAQLHLLHQPARYGDHRGSPPPGSTGANGWCACRATRSCCDGGRRTRSPASTPCPTTSRREERSAERKR